jgi:hypothetical protein
MNDGVRCTDAAGKVLYCKDLRKVSTHVGCSRTMGLEAWFLTRSTVVGRGVRLIIEHTYVYTFSYSTDFTSE